MTTLHKEKTIVKKLFATLLTTSVLVPGIFIATGSEAFAGPGGNQGGGNQGGGNQGGGNQGGGNQGGGNQGGGPLTLINGTTCSITDLTGSNACEGAFDGNNSNQSLSGLFGVTGWSELTKIDTTSGIFSYSNDKLEFSGSSLNSGIWAFGSGFNPSQYQNIMFVLKGGPSFSAYQWDGSTTSGTWNTNGLLNGNGGAGPGLSHFSIYTTPCTDPNGCTPKPVPEPASALLGLAGLGILGIVKKKTLS